MFSIRYCRLSVCSIALLIGLLSNAALHAQVTLGNATLADITSGSPSVTNDRNINVTLTDPISSSTMVRIAENPGFSPQTSYAFTGNGPYVFNLSAGDAIKTVYTRVSNSDGNSNTIQKNIRLDTGGPIPVATASNPNPTSGTAKFSVTFNEDVTGFNSAGDVTLLFTGTVAAGGPVSITQNSPSNYTVTVNSVSGNGTLKIRVPANAAQDGAGNNSAVSADSTAVTIDNIKPFITQFITARPSTNADEVLMDIQWNEAVGGFTQSDVIAQIHPGVVLTVASLTKLQDDLYRLRLTGVSGDGLTTWTVNASAAADLAGNSSVAFTPGFELKIDNTPPDPDFTSALPDPTATVPVQVTLAFTELVENQERSEEVVGFNTGLLTITGGTLSNFQILPAIPGTRKPNSTFTFNLTPNTANQKGPMTVDLAGNLLEDLATNKNLPAKRFSITVGYSVKHPRQGGGDFSTIQAALNSSLVSPAGSGRVDAVIVYQNPPSTMTEGPFLYFESIDFKGKNVVLVSENPNDPEVVNNTVIRSPSNKNNPLTFAPVVTFSGTETEQCVFRGFRVENGTGKVDIANQKSPGGGIYGAGARPRIENNIFAGNAGSEGGAIFNADGPITNNLIAQNTALSGGGLYGCDGLIQNNNILQNTAVNSVGGINGAGVGGGLSTCNGTIRNNIIFGNTADTSNPQIHNSATPTYCCIEGGSAGTGNISGNPLFVNSNFGNPATLDLHLQAASPCIDTGGVADGVSFDAEGRKRPIDGKENGFGTTGDGSDYDIGFSEYAANPNNPVLPAIQLMQVTPVISLNGSGNEGGPFTPNSITYQVANNGFAILHWSVSSVQNFVSLNPASGQLLPGKCAFVLTQFNANANTLGQGVHQSNLNFVNQDNNFGNATRLAQLNIAISPGAPVMEITPITPFASQGYQGGPFDPAAKDYLVENAGGGVLDYRTSPTVSWLSSSLAAGSLGAGNSQNITVSINSKADLLAAQSPSNPNPYIGNVWFFNDTNSDGTTSITVNLRVDIPGATMTVTPAESEEFEITGPVGGPFTPVSKNYTIGNPSTQFSLNYSVQKNEDWLTLSNTGGTLGVTSSAQITASVNTNANGLSAGVYNDAIAFVNETNGSGSASRNVTLTVTAPPDDGYGNNNTMNTAFDLSDHENDPLSEIDGLGVQGDDDWYKITVDPNSGVTCIQATFEHDDGNIDITLYDAQGNIAGSSLSLDDDEEICVSGLAPGEYFIKVDGDDNGNTYDLVWSDITDDNYEPNDVRVQAFDFSNDQVVLLSSIDGPGVQADDDWYQVVVGAESALFEATLTFTHSQGNLLLELRNSAGGLVTSSNSSDDDEFIAQNGLAAGTYFLVVKGNNRGNNYDLSWRDCRDDDYEENDTRPTAFDLRTRGGQLLSTIDGPGFELDDDWYRITVTNPATELVRVRLLFQHAAGDLALELFNAAGTSVASANTSTNNETILYLNPAAADYFIKVSGPHNCTQYDLVWEAITDDNYSPNGTMGTAHDLTNFEGTPLSGVDGEGVQLDDDWFKITIGPNTTRLNISAFFDHSLGNIDIELYDALGNLVGSSLSLDDDELISLLDPAAGTYFIRVTGDNTGNSYDLLWEVITDDNYEDPAGTGTGNNDTRDDATDISGFPGTPISEIDGPGNQEGDDWYRIVVPANAIRLLVDAFFTHAEGNIDMQLTDAAGNVLVAANSTDDDEHITRELPAAGVYFIRIHGDNNSNEYDLVWDVILDDSFTGNDSMADAFDLTPFEEIPLSDLDGPGVQSGDDRYQITIPPGVDVLDIQALFQHLNGNIDLQLYDSDGNVVASSLSAGDNEHIIYADPAAGTYFIRIFGDDEGNVYDLIWNMIFDDNYFTDPTDGGTTEPIQNDTIDTAFDLTDDGSTTGPLHLADVDGPGVQTNTDYYRISVDPASDILDVQAIFQHALGNIDIQLLNSLNVLVGSSASQDDNEHIRIRIDHNTGTTYTICVTGPNNGNEYDLIWYDFADDVFEDNDTMNNATDISGNEGNPVSDQNGGLQPTQNDDDWYQVHVDAADDVLSVEVNFDPNLCDIEVILYDANGVEVARATPANGNANIVFQLPGGTAEDYFVLVTGEDCGNSYDLTWNADGDGDDNDNDNDTSATATDYTVNDDVCLSDLSNVGLQLDDDWYEINVAANTDLLLIEAFFNSNLGQIDLHLLDATATVVGAASATDSGSRIAYLDPAAGHYFIRITGDDRGNRYDLCWHTINDDAYETNASLEQNDDLAHAADLTDSAGVKLSDIDGLGVQIDNDWYEIDIPSGRQGVIVTAQFAHSSGNIDLALFDSTGHLVAAANSSTNDETIIYNLPFGASGTYFIRVSGDNVGNSYDLVWSTFLEDNYEDNDVRATAFDISTQENILLSSVDGRGIQRNDDWYRIEVNPRVELLTVELFFIHENGNIDLQLYDAAGKLLAASSTQANNEKAQLELPASGTYYVRVKGGGNGNSYDLVWRQKLLLSDRWFFAEGETRNGFETFLLVINPDPANPTEVELTILFASQDPLVVKQSLPANARFSFNIGLLLVANNRSEGALGMFLRSEDDALIYAERAMYWPQSPNGAPIPRTGGTDGTGLPFLARDWFLAEGSSSSGRQTLISVANPTTQTAQLAVTFLVENNPNVEQFFTVRPKRRLTIEANQYVPNREFSTRIVSIGESPAPVVVERSMYNGVAAHGGINAIPLKWGHTAQGVTRLADTWYLAEGATHSTFETFLLIANPNKETITADIRFLLATGGTVSKTVTVGPETRRTINVELSYAEMHDQGGFATVITARDGKGIVVERAQYFKTLDFTERTAATAVVGLNTVENGWYLPEGAVGGSSKFEAFILVGNPSETDAAVVDVTFYLTDGSVNTANSPYTVQPGQRLTVKANDFLNGSAGTVSFATTVRSRNNVPTVAERAMYWTINNIPRWEGHASTAIPEF